MWKIKTYFENRILLFIGFFVVYNVNKNILKSLWFFISGWFISYNKFYPKFRKYEIEFYLKQNIDNLDKHSKINLIILSEEYNIPVDKINLKLF